MQNANVADVIEEARKQIDPKWGLRGNLRVFEVSDGRLQRIHSPEHSVRSLNTFNRRNVFFNCLRIEVGDNDPPSHQTFMEIFHCDRQSQQAFGQPLLMPLSAGEKSAAVKSRCKEKLKV